MITLAREHSNLADFALVYIAEAHACDEWPIHSARCTFDRQPVEILQPRTLSSRLEIARSFMKNYGFVEGGLRLLVDNPEPCVLVGPECYPITVEGNSFERVFAPWPLRFYVIGEGRLRYISQPEEGRFSVEELKAAVIHESDRLLSKFSSDPSL